MDEYPAGPASPGPRRPSLSVVIPVHDGGSDFERCLRGLRNSTWADYECVVVDDASRDGSGELARSFGARVYRHDACLGPAAARNFGALQASGEIIFFLDADVAVHPDAIARGMARFDGAPDLAAVFGSYDDRPAAPGLVSRFRNLLHHHVHQSGDFEDDARPARTFWTGCGFIRRAVFDQCGGFDPRRYRRPAIEDIELGYRVVRAGHRILLARDVLSTHLKRWGLVDMVRTDIFRRGVPWMLLMKRSGVVETDLNVSGSQKACVAATGLGGLALLGTPWAGWLAPLVPAALGAVVLLNAEFYRFLRRTRGVGFAVAASPLHLVYYACCGASVAIALGIWHLGGRKLAADAAPMPGRRVDPAGAPSPHIPPREAVAADISSPSSTIPAAPNPQRSAPR